MADNVVSIAYSLILDELMEDDDGTDALISTFRMSVASAMVALASVFSVRRESDPVRIVQYVESIVPLYSELDFRSHFRMRRGTFQMLCECLGPILTERKLSLEKKLLSTMWLLANQESYRGIADRFGISKGTLHLTALSAYKAIASLRENLIKFPDRRDFPKIANGFSQRCGFPGVVGAVDGTHIPIPAPRTAHRLAYINRKGFSSMQLQVICDSNLMFLDIYTGWPGSVHDARVFKQSPISKALKENYLPSEFHLIGDSAYPMSENLLIPFRDNGHLGIIEKKYNKCHSSTRVDVERAIGLLKCKFRRLKYLDMYLAEEVTDFIAACCVLHNFILKEEDVIDTVDDTDTDNISSEDQVVNEHLSTPAQAKRWEIANLL
ncbi:hypothetical protein ScPMuIL_003633 [Solemya velum]